MISRFANPARFMRISAAALPWCSWSALAVLAVGLYLALIVGPPDVGRLVGLGCAADLGAGPVLSLSGLHRAGERVRRAEPRRKGRLGAGAGRSRQPADRQVLGRLVEHPAPAGECRATRRTQD